MYDFLLVFYQACEFDRQPTVASSSPLVYDFLLVFYHDNACEFDRQPTVTSASSPRTQYRLVGSLTLAQPVTVASAHARFTVHRVK